MKKNYILDTNVLLHDPDSLLSFEENDVLLPIEVIEEIDRFKRESTELGQNARTVSRMLDGFRGAGRLSEGVSSTQGGHQVAQKFRTSSLPPNPAAETVWPLSALMVKSGAESPTVVILSRNVFAITKTNVTVRSTIASRRRRSVLGLLMEGKI